MPSLGSAEIAIVAAVCSLVLVVPICLLVLFRAALRYLNTKQKLAEKQLSEHSS